MCSVNCNCLLSSQESRTLSIAWSLQLRNRAAVATDGCELHAIFENNPQNHVIAFLLQPARRKPCDCSNEMVASLLAAAVVAAILQSELCAVKF